MKRTYGAEIENLFQSGPSEDLIVFDMAKFNRIYGDDNEKKNTFASQTSRKPIDN